MRIVYRIVQSAAFLALHGLAGNQVSYVNHVAQFAKLAGGLAALEQFFRLLVKNIQAVPCAGQAGVAADDAYIGFHNLVHFLHALRNEHTLFVGDGALVVPFGDVFVEIITFQYAQRMLGGCIGINYRFNQRVGSQAVAAVKTGARAFADGIQAADAGLSVQVYLDTAAEIVCRRATGM